MSDIRQAEITIMGRRFAVNTPAQAHSTLMQAAEMLNSKIEGIRAMGHIVETDRIIILAALNLAHDLLNMTMKDGLAVGDFERKIEHLIRVCDEAVEHGKSV